MVPSGIALESSEQRHQPTPPPREEEDEGKSLFLSYSYTQFVKVNATRCVVGPRCRWGLKVNRSDVRVCPVYTNYFGAEEKKSWKRREILEKEFFCREKS